MSYIEFDKLQLINLEYSLSKEVIRSNGSGSYACTTLAGCNTRKYHGLLICPLKQVDGGNHVLLSSLDETLIQRESSFNLSIHRYPGVYEPRGHKYIREFEAEPIMALIYRVGGVFLKKEMMLVAGEDRVLIRYTLLDAHSPTKLRFKPFLAFRNIHSLSKANLDVNTNYYTVKNGVKVKMYQPYPYLYMQFSKAVEYVPVPHWYYNLEYLEEQKRGYDFHEDLYVPGYFELSIKKGESIVFSAGTSEAVTPSLNKFFNKELESRIPRNNYQNCLVNSAHQFIARRGSKTEIIAGFPWFGRWGRDTFIALPGLTLAVGDPETCKEVLDTMAGELKGPLFPNIGSDDHSSYNSVDAPLWFFWAIQQYCEYTNSWETIWKEYGAKMKKILEGYRNGTEFNIKMHENGLIYAGDSGHALTWMDAVIHGKPVTPRIGYDVEINALWYNAIMFSMQVAKISGDKKFIKEWLSIPELIKFNFNDLFWNKKMGYLADYISDGYKDWAVRPNQIFAISLPFQVLDEENSKSVLDVVAKELLTPRGLRTLAPNHPAYIGVYEGDQESRDKAYHQGTVWPWLLEHFSTAYLKIYGSGGVSLINKLYKGFEEEMTVCGIGTISEIYEGDPPHRPCGAISQAWSVAALLRMKRMIEKYK